MRIWALVNTIANVDFAQLLISPNWYSKGTLWISTISSTDLTRIPVLGSQVSISHLLSQVSISPKSQPSDPTLLLKRLFHLPIKSWVILIQTLLWSLRSNILAKMRGCHQYDGSGIASKSRLARRGETNWRIPTSQDLGKQGSDGAGGGEVQI